MSITPKSPALIKQRWVQTWVTSQWKNPSIPGQISAEINRPWAECVSDAERLHVHNGLLLSALWDAAFDRGLVTFNDEGKPQFSQALSEAARGALRWQGPLPLTDEHRIRLARHRVEVFDRQ